MFIGKLPKFGSKWKYFKISVFLSHPASQPSSQMYANSATSNRILISDWIFFQSEFPYFENVKIREKTENLIKIRWIYFHEIKTTR